MGRKVGDPSSKYAYQPERLEKDIAEKAMLRETAGQTIREHIRRAVYYSGLQPETGMQIVLEEVRKVYAELNDMEERTDGHYQTD